MRKFESFRSLVDYWRYSKNSFSFFLSDLLAKYKQALVYHNSMDDSHLADSWSLGV